MSEREVQAEEKTDGLVLAADIGGTNIRVAVVDRNGVIKEKLKEPTGSDPIKILIEMIKRLHAPQIKTMGIALAGVINASKRGVSRSPNIPSIEGVDIVSVIKKEIPLEKVIVENDANASAYGEAWIGAGKEYEDFVLMTLGTGIGGGVVCRGGLAPFSAEIGHMTIVSNGDICACGNVGCLELYASGRAIVERALKGLMEGIETELRSSCEGNIYRITPEEVYRIALEGDSFSRELIKEAGKYLGIGIANVINIFSPQAIILTGGLTGMWNIYIQEALKEAQKRAFKELFEHTKILPSALGDDGGLIGAAGLALRNA